jgi:hypothetical protein
MCTLIVDQGGAQSKGTLPAQTAGKLGLPAAFFQNHQWKCQNANDPERKEKVFLVLGSILNYFIQLHKFHPLFFMGKFI